MKLCYSCEQRLFDEIAKAIKGCSDLWPEEFFVPLVDYGPEIAEDVFLAAMAKRGWLNCKRCHVWVHSTGEDGLCEDCQDKPPARKPMRVLTWIKRSDGQDARGAR